MTNLDDVTDEMGAALPPVELDFSSPGSCGEESDDDDQPPLSIKKRQNLTVIALLPGRTPIRTQSEVAFEMREALRDLVCKAKAIHCKGTSLDTIPNAHDITQLLKGGICCRTGHWIYAPNVGLFTKNIGANSTGAIKAPKGKAISGRYTTKITSCIGTKASQAKKPSRPDHKISKTALKMATESHSSARQVKKPVYVGCKEGTKDVATFTFYDENHRMFPKSSLPNIKLYSGVKSLDEAKGHAMQLHDRFYMSRGREYNLRAAIYLARQRLTCWANGNDVDSRPEGEDKGMFVEYTLMRNLECSDEAAMEMCREVQVPKLWVGMDHLTR
ncbi:hypothetical protein F5883DRAFT_518414 [Diaporthe sp. PMI_573]|nr:hypothetical protein F5883DRAFT_518414 [Diaporthaceae sp. PMI_573]